MPNDRWEFSAAVPENYDRYLVPIMFDPYARDLAQRVADSARGEVLELACGTGAVTRRLHEVLPASCPILATDLSAAMLAVAQRRLPADARLAWQTADASALPFPARRFGAVVFQFGLMFVPDPGAALREARRVLRDDGSLFLSVWDAPASNPHAEVFEGVARRFVLEPDALEDFARPFSMSDRAVLKNLLESSGFERVSLEVVQREAVSPSAADWARGAVLGTPRGAQFQAAGIALEPLIEALGVALAARGGSAPCRMPTQAIICIATATSA
jgi:ubiquinone/menaquinone biosynthesis C-methylase UbiE